LEPTLSRILFEILSDFLVSVRVPQALDSLRFDLPDPLPAQPELPSDLLKGALPILTDSKAEPEDLLLSR